MTVKGGTSQACAACKFQRRKCSSDCPLAPYFPPDRPKEFQNAHKLFGVSNILKILKKLEPSEHMEAMKSIVYQANIRDSYPVTGCYGVVNELYIMIQRVQHELEMVNAQLALYRNHHHNIKLEHQLTSSPPPPPPHAPPSSKLQLGSSGALSLFHPPLTSSILIGTHHPAHKNPNALWAQEYDEISPFFDSINIDDRQYSYIESKDANETSSESSLKDTTQSTENVEENELKSAAARFTLTSVNQP